MKQRPDARELLHATVPIVVAILVLATAPIWQAPLVDTVAPALAPLVVVFLLAVLGGLYLPTGAHTLALGTMALPVAVWFFGVAWTGWIAGVAYVARELGRRLLFGVPLRSMEWARALPTITDAARVAVAGVVAASVWLLATGGDLATVAESSFFAWGLVAAVSYVATLTVAHWLESMDLDSAAGRFPTAVLKASVLDVMGWLVGAVAVRLVLSTGWFEPLVLLVAVAVLATEVARNFYLRQRALTRASELWEVTKAGHRIIFRGPDLAGMVEHVLEECHKVMPFHWFQFELVSFDGQNGSWYAGPDGKLEEGLPEPADSPPALPGIHRRVSWKVIQRQLKGDGEPIAMLRFWCDPRNLETASIELLDSLLPQIAAAVHRSMLDRKAKQDPLTGLADRRVLEARLEEVFVQTYALGGHMAVIMCDLDRFKKINDTYGHGVGDRALKQVVEILEEHRRDTDLCSRYGGEEFALVLEKTDGETALRIAERLRVAVENCLFVPEDKPVALRMSAGVASYPSLQVKEGKDLLVLADEALIESKKRGRNRSLLNLGRDRFQNARGQVVGSRESAAEPEAPTLFA